MQASSVMRRARGLWGRAGSAAFVCGLGLVLPLFAMSAARAQAAGLPSELACHGSAGRAEAVRLASISDGGELTLEDGRRIVLAGVWLAQPGRDALRDMLAPGTGLTVRDLGPEDRWGRRSAQVVAPGGWLQGRLLSDGFAFVLPPVKARGNAAPAISSECLRELQLRESVARKKLGADWGEGVRLRSGDLAGLSERTGLFTIVEGPVVSLGKSGQTRYLNFGRHWSSDFTVTIDARLDAELAAKGVPPEALEGRWVRVRGILQDRNGPLLEVTDPVQIEAFARDRVSGGE
ncbi:Endonuclease YncB, thermonuclease family [Pannonibacter indicus]|uniref:Endonuclease YncB, thermonuclease family n=2 Tax=Pannonibacter indicus TaxID=466044 RepID=A0A0K6I2B1_9HYPH|nr:Endonuclease YncB, thermonuclease family [Pannonibacter indicus]